MRRVDRIVKPEDVTERDIVEFKFSACQREILKLLYEMRILSTKSITAILDKKEAYIKIEIIKLYKSGFLQRMALTPEQGAGEKERVYWMLDRGGALFIAGAYGISMKNINWNIRNNMIKYEKLAHAIKVGECMTQLTKVAREAGHKVESAFCDTHLRYEFTSEDKNLTICPDLFIVYNTGEMLYQYFFEIDMGTMPMTGLKTRSNVVVNKVPKYEKFFTSKEFKSGFEVNPRIVFLTTNKVRAESLLKNIKSSKSTELNLEFLISTFDNFREHTLQKCFKSTNKENGATLFI